MTEVSFDADRIRIKGPLTGAEVQVRPAPAVDRPAMAGSLTVDGDDLLFRPRFGFVDGTTYTVWVGGAVVATLARPRPGRPATTEVAHIYPTAAEVPRNLLRCYVWFTQPMSIGYAQDHLRLVDDAGTAIEGALLPFDHELWDAGRTRLTVLLDPARIKRGLASNLELGYALHTGQTFRLVVDPGFLDAQGLPLKHPGERRYRVTADQRRRVDPGDWKLSTPTKGSREPLHVEFDRPLDHGLLARCLHVADVDGTTELGDEQLSWTFTPREPWAAATRQLVVDPILEDVAGNSVTRVFDRDLDQDHRPVSTALTF